MTKEKVALLQKEIQRHSDIFLDVSLYPHESWKKAAYVLCGAYPNSWEEVTGDIVLKRLSVTPSMPLIWRDVAYELLKFTTRREPCMVYYLPTVENMPVCAIGSSVAVSCAVFSFLHRVNSQEKASILRRWFSKKQRSQLLPLDPPVLPGFSLPDEDIRPAWYTANYIAYALFGIYRETSSDGWEQYLLSLNPAYTEETRDENGVAPWKSVMQDKNDS